jgi:hypothetical protein
VLEGVQDEAGVRLADGSDELSLFRTDGSHERTLYVVRQSRLDGSFSEPARVASDVGPQYSFSAHLPDTVLALVQESGAGRTLKQFWFESGLESTIRSRVTSYYESERRETLLYATTGSAAGLYYSGIR